MNGLHIAIVGGGAAGFFAAIRAAEVCPGARITILEQGVRVLAKVRISGGGRCNVTNACFEPRELSKLYPRGGRELLGPFHQFGSRETVAWFEQRKVPLKTEPDGRMFPVTDNSEAIIACLVDAATRAGVEIRMSARVEQIAALAEGMFEVQFGRGRKLECDRLMLATGGCRGTCAGQLACGLGHTLIPPVPSLFTFRVGLPWLRALSGISVGDVEIGLPGSKLKERGPLLITHEGLSGPAVLRLSAWGARVMADRGYQFNVRLNWYPERNRESLVAEFTERRSKQSARYITNSAVAPVPARLWEQLVLRSGIPAGKRWADLSGCNAHELAGCLTGMDLPVCGKSLNQDEFVTCGGVPLGEVNLKTMESRVCPGLFFGGELLDIDGVTGGFNFQAAWTTGWLAGTGLAGTCACNQ